MCGRLRSSSSATTTASPLNTPRPWCGSSRRGLSSGWSLVPRAGLIVPAEMVLSEPDAVPGSCFAVVIAGLLQGLKRALAELQRSIVIAEARVRPAQAVKGEGLPHGVALPQVEVVGRARVA